MVKSKPTGFCFVEVSSKDAQTLLAEGMVCPSAALSTAVCKQGRAQTLLALRQSALSNVPDLGCMLF